MQASAQQITVWLRKKNAQKWVVNNLKYGTWVTVWNGDFNLQYESFNRLKSNRRCVFVLFRVLWFYSLFKQTQMWLVLVRKLLLTMAKACSGTFEIILCKFGFRYGDLIKEKKRVSCILCTHNHRNFFFKLLWNLFNFFVFIELKAIEIFSTWFNYVKYFVWSTSGFFSTLCYHFLAKHSPYKLFEII